MTRTEQYKLMPKVLDVAIKNGWKDGVQYKNLLALYPANFGRNFLTDNYYRILITNHDFCKAFFGTELCEFKMFSKVKGEGISEIVDGNLKMSNIESLTCTLELPKWMWHLQQMVLMEDPLKYISPFLEDLTPEN